MSIAFSKVEPELENLSDRAKIAIAARCARRVEPLACHLTREQREALRAAIDGLEAYAKGEKFQKIPAEALRTLQQLEYTDVGAEAAYVALRASEGVILREEEKFQEEKFSLNQVTGLRRPIVLILRLLLGRLITRSLPQRSHHILAHFELRNPRSTVRRLAISRRGS